MYHVFTKKWGNVYRPIRKTSNYFKKKKKKKKKKNPRKENNNNFVLLQEGDTL